MKKIILFIFIIAVASIIAGGAIVYAKDFLMFDVFFSEKTKEERALNRMAKLYPEKLGDFNLYGRGAEKIRKNREECNEVNETLNKENLEIKGTVCARITIGEYRNIDNKVIFVQIMKITKGKDIPGIDYLFGKLTMADKLKGHNIMRPENHEIGWFPADDSKIDVILTQEGAVRKNPDGGESMLYQNKATGDNLITQYFISKYPPIASPIVNVSNVPAECEAIVFDDNQTKKIVLEGKEYEIKSHIEAEDSWASFSVDGDKGLPGEFYNVWGNLLMAKGNTSNVPDTVIINGVSITLKQVGYNTQRHEFAEICIGQIK